MATKTKAKEREETSEAAEPQTDGPLLDLTDAGVKKMIKAAKKRGYVTMDELNQVLPSEEFTSDQIEDVFGQLSEMGINVVESEEVDENAEPGESHGGGDEEESEGGELVEQPRPAPVETKKASEP